jgi:hypothetical protein
MKPTVTDICDNIAPMQTFDPDWGGSCPCGKVKGDGFSIVTKCWRSGDHPPGCAVYVEGKDIKPTDKLLIAVHVASSTGWGYCDWHLYIDGELFGRLATNDKEDDDDSD